MRFKLRHLLFFILLASCGVEQEREATQAPQPAWQAETNLRVRVKYRHGVQRLLTAAAHTDEDMQRQAFLLDPDEGQVLAAIRAPESWQPIEAKPDSPFSVIGRLRGCSGVLIGPHHALTAAHCVYRLEDGGWQSDLSFQPFGQDQRVPWAWVMVPEPFLHNRDVHYDVAVIGLAQAASLPKRWLPIRPPPLVTTPIALMGFPRQQPPGPLWVSGCTLEAEQNSLLYHRCLSSQGSSGSAIVTLSAHNELSLIGLHTHGTISADQAKYGSNLTGPLAAMIHQAITSL